MRKWTQSFIFMWQISIEILEYILESAATLVPRAKLKWQLRAQGNNLMTPESTQKANSFVQHEEHQNGIKGSVIMTSLKTISGKTWWLHFSGTNSSLTCNAA